MACCEQAYKNTDAESEPNRPPIRMRTRSGRTEPNPNLAVPGPIRIRTPSAETDPNPNSRENHTCSDRTILTAIPKLIKHNQDEFLWRRRLPIATQAAGDMAQPNRGPLSFIISEHPAANVAAAGCSEGGPCSPTGPPAAYAARAGVNPHSEREGAAII